jgi:hypothetical protein
MAAQENTSGIQHGEFHGSAPTRQKAYKVVWHDISETTEIVRMELTMGMNSKSWLGSWDTPDPDGIGQLRAKEHVRLKNIEEQV